MAGRLDTKSLLDLASDMGIAGGPSDKYIAEFTRRQTDAQIKAAKAQVWSAWLQLFAVIAMFLTVIVTAIHSP